MSVPCRLLTTSALLLIACRDERPAPFGSVLGKLPSWQEDCDAPLVTESLAKWPEEMTMRARDRVFTGAKQRYVCKPPGWSLYVDGNERILGICVDDDTHTYAEPMLRARPLLARHVSPQFARDVTEAKCNLIPDRVAHGLLRWHEIPGVARPDGTFDVSARAGTTMACCWEVFDP